MSSLLLTAAAFLLCVAGLAAQQSDAPPATQSLDLTVQGRAALKSPQTWLPPEPRSVGILTLRPVIRPGEFLRFSLPAGELAADGVRAIGKTHRRRAERKARETVQRDLRAFLAQKPMP
jgi:hypothetical protein